LPTRQPGIEKPGNYKNKSKQPETQEKPEDMKGGKKK
jgi:hypothetical protein